MPHNSHSHQDIHSHNFPVYNDINTGMNPRNTGANRPALASFIGNINEFQFAIDDYADMVPIELLHDWKEGTPVELHIHWATGGENDDTVRGVKWEFEYSYADKGGIFIPTFIESKETSIDANEVALSSKYTSVTTFTPPTKIGTQLVFRIKRIASVATAPVANPFVLSVGVHYQIDAIGSRTIAAK